jgi:hypothetical protein
VIVLPRTVRRRPTFRIRYMPAGSWTTTPQPWEVLPIPAVYAPSTLQLMGGTVAQGGYHLGSIARWCLPDEDRAEFYIDTGEINGVTVSDVDLSNNDICIQVYDDESFPSEADTALDEDGWKSVFVGTVISVKRSVLPGGTLMGRTTYYCAGILWRTSNWPLNRHSTADREHQNGNPGYNIPLHGWFRKVLGNKGTGNPTDPYGDLNGGYASAIDGYINHNLPVDGAASPASVWTDEEVVRHALISSRAAGEPVIDVDLSNGLFARGLPWTVSPGETCADLLKRVCNRQRGRGAVFVSYFDNPGNGDVGLLLEAHPSHAEPFSYRSKANWQDQSLDDLVDVPAPKIGVSAIEVDLNGDHRLDGPIQWEDRYSSVFDHLVVQGEPIQVLCNLNLFGSSLVKRWSAADETAFAAIPLENVTARKLPRWRHVWRRFGIPETPAMTVKAEPAATAYSINYKTTSTGTIVIPGTGGDDARTSEMTLRFLADLPIYEGWDYSTSEPVRFDAGTDYLPPTRMPPVVLMRADDDADGSPAWVPLTSAGFGYQSDDFGFLIVHGVEDQFGVRLLAPSDTQPNVASVPFDQVNLDGVSSPIDLAKLNTIIGVELGARVSLSPNVLPYEDAGRRMVMTVNGIHLWLGAPGAVWELDYTRGAVEQYRPGLKFYGTAPYILRDDRNELAFIAALASQYYLIVHNPATWALKDCGLLTSFSTASNGQTYYPTLGQMVPKLTYSGQQGAEESLVLNTNVTSIFYDNEAGVTTWRTDFVSYDGNMQ